MKDLTLKEALDIMPEHREALMECTIASIRELAHGMVSFGPDRWGGIVMFKLIAHVRHLESLIPEVEK